MKQTQVIVNQKFTLTKGHGHTITYKPGKYPIPKEDAAHWWAQQFITILPSEPEVVELTPETLVEDTPIKIDTPVKKRNKAS